MAKRMCLDCPPDCPTLTDGTRCEPCRLKHDRQRERGRNRPTARQRGYDTQHDATRARLLPLAYGTPCPRCHEPMLAGQDLDLGHTVARSVDPQARADRIEHAACNRAAGAT